MHPKIGDTVLTKNKKPMLDRDKNILHYGDIIYWEVSQGVIDECIILHNGKTALALLTTSRWYSDNAFNVDSYGKAYVLPLDNRARMQIVLKNDLKTKDR